MYHRINAMGTKDKLIERFKAMPSDFTYEEMVRLFAIFGYHLSNKGKTSGSRISFVNGNDTYTMHKPHNPPYFKNYAMKQTKQYLEDKHLI